MSLVIELHGQFLFGLFLIVDFYKFLRARQKVVSKYMEGKVAVIEGRAFWKCITTFVNDIRCLRDNTQIGGMLLGFHEVLQLLNLDV